MNTRTVLNGHCKPVVLTPENCTRDGWGWSDGIGWDDLEWAHAEFLEDSVIGVLQGTPDPHVSLPHKDKFVMGTRHRVRGRRWKITGLLP